MWQFLLADTCSLSIGGGADVINIAVVMAMLPLFMFARLEFLRNKDSTIFTTISEIENAMHVK